VYISRLGARQFRRCLCLLVLTGFGLLVWLTAGASPAEAHTVGPQLLSRFDAISPPAPGVSYQILSTGAAPYVTVAVSGNHTFQIFGWLGEPFIKIGPDGVQINRNSPSVEFMITDPTKVLALPAVTTQQPRWETVSTGTVYHYYERRAEWPHIGQPEEAQAIGRKAIVYRFRIPASYDGRPAAILGHVTWVPSPINFEIPLLFLPIIVVILLWIEPKARSYFGKIVPAAAVVTIIGTILGGAQSLLARQSYGHGLVGLAPIAVLPGLLAVAVVAVPRLLAGDRRAYAWVMITGVYLIIFGLIRVDLSTTSMPALVTIARRAQVLDGVAVACSAGLLLFLTSPVRPTGAQEHPAGPSQGDVASVPQGP
jgi:hypothetical protein